MKKILSGDITGVCYNCLNGFHDGCDHSCSCEEENHKAWWWKPDINTDGDMYGSILKVQDFHSSFGVPIKDEPEIPADRVELRHRILQEEVNELHEAMKKGDIVETLDALCDILYVTFGTAHETGLAWYLEEAFNEVHESNMSKLDENGIPILREDGKVLKSNRYHKPDLKKILYP